MNHIGKLIIIVGVLFVIVGVVIYFWGDRFSWLGRLPGDIRIEKDNFRFYFPITTMIIISLVVSALIRLFQKFFN
jgi:hypothetical protein